MTKHELLVPVGNYDSLIAAINNGADAVYLGGKKFGARAFAENFSLEKIEEATKLCHLYGVKIYITVNTLVYENEFEEALNYIKELHRIGVDAVIMQDVGLINVVHHILPNLEIHASTQMHNHSSESIKFLEDLGIKRIVFARELSLDYIDNIKTNLEKEVFIHGSLCVSYSGQCLFSSCILGRSGNRGECAGMCRLPYKLYENENEIKTDGDYILSPKDLCSIDNIKKLLDSNITCFKIEGRMKSPAYVGIVTKIYRNLIDQFNNNEELKVDEEDLFLLKAIFNREYTSGFLHNENKIMNFEAPNHLGIGIGKVTNVTNKKIEIKLDHKLEQFEGIRFKKNNIGLTINFMYDKNNKLINRAERGDIIYLDNFVNLQTKDEVVLTNPLIKLDTNIIKKINVTSTFVGKLDEEMVLTVSDFVNEVSVKGNIIKNAISSPITNERIYECLNKTGNTPFINTNIDIITDNNIFIPIGELNNLRRNALEKLKELRENTNNNYIELKYVEESVSMPNTHSLNVVVKNKEQLKACRDLNVENIIVINKNLYEDGLIYRVPRDSVIHNYSMEKILVTDYASLYKYRNKIADYHLNITNHHTINYLSKYASSLMLSVEATTKNIKDMILNRKFNTEVLVYGRIELMLMKYCPLNTIVNKNKICSICKNNNKYYLKDRNSKFYPLENNNETHSTSILNCNITNNISNIEELKEYGVTNFRIEFFDESYEDAKDIIERVMSKL